MKKMQKLLIGLLSLALLLTACGGEKKEDPNAGLYHGDQINILGWEPIEDVYEGTNTIELKSGGKGTFTLDGEELPIDWALDGETLTMESSGEKCSGTLKDGVIQTDLFGVEIQMTFVKEGASAPVFEDTAEDFLESEFLEEEEEEPDEEADEEMEEAEAEPASADGAIGEYADMYAEYGYAEYSIDDGAYLIYYPQDQFVIDETYFPQLKNTEDDFSISFLTRYSESDHEAFLSKCEEVSDQPLYELTESVFLGYDVLQLVYEDMGELVMEYHINFGEPTGSGEDYCIDLIVRGWNHCDQEEVMGIIDTLEIH